MVTAHAFLAILAGFVSMAMLMIAATTLLRRLAPALAESQLRPQPAYVLVNMGCSFIAAVLGGYLTAWAAGAGALADMLVLAIVVLVLGAISTLMARGPQPVWYQMVLLVTAPLGVVAGGLLRLRVVGIL